MATLSDIIFYPVKSCAGISVRRSGADRSRPRAVDGVCDREWMVVERGWRQFLTQREYPRMALVTPRLQRRHARAVRARPAAACHCDRPAEPAAPRAACALGRHRAGRRTAAMPAPPGSRRRSARHAGWCIFPPARAASTSTRWTGGVAAPTRFADGYPVLVIGAASLADLNDKLRAAGRPALPMNRFRPNLVIDGIGAVRGRLRRTIRASARRGSSRSSRARAARSRRSTRPPACRARIRSTSCRPTGASRSWTTRSVSA